MYTMDLSEHSIDDLQRFVGQNDDNLHVIEKAYDVSFFLRASTLKWEEDANTQEIQDVVNACFDCIDVQKKLESQDVHYLISLAKHHQLSHFHPSQRKAIGQTKTGKIIYPKTLGQARFCNALYHNDIIFATGVAGTGKTYLAVVYAVSQLKREKIKRIILTRPAVEAGESLGFLPGDMKEKVDPYLRPLYDALYEMLGQETVERYLEKQIIEIAPLAFMRGRTLNDAVVILDEAQNTTQSQMKMFLTRMGQHSQLIINGDVSQIDLIKKSDSGLRQACQILKGISGIAIVQLSKYDVVRHPLVQKIIERYEEIEK